MIIDITLASQAKCLSLPIQLDACIITKETHNHIRMDQLKLFWWLSLSIQGIKDQTSGKPMMLLGIMDHSRHERLKRLSTIIRLA